MGHNRDDMTNSDIELAKKLPLSENDDIVTLRSNATFGTNKPIPFVSGGSVAIPPAPLTTAPAPSLGLVLPGGLSEIIPDLLGQRREGDWLCI